MVQPFTIRTVNPLPVKPPPAKTSVDVRPAATAGPRFQPVHSHRTFEEICRRIRAHLAEGGLKPGDKLPDERDLAAQLGVGRNTLREALRTLEIAGLVERPRGARGGVFISQGDTGRMDQVMRDLLSLGSISVTDLAEARVHLLELVVRLACDRAVQSDFDALDANIERTREITATGRFLERVECSREFYRLLGEATHNPVLGIMVHALSEILMQFVYARVAAGGKPHPRLVETRRQFVAALRDRDGELASRMMRKHLEAVHEMLAASLGEAGLASARMTSIMTR
jgi:GntR family transcriptional regulator, transcriptional repressor for pyruvate dehydrogenase complex